MGVDIRLPIGLMFAVLGVLMSGYGLLGDKAIYARSLGININLVWGIVLIVFGGIMLALASRGGRKANPDETDELPSPDSRAVGH